MSNEYIVTLLGWFLFYIYFWLKVDRSASRTNRHTGRVGFITERIEKIIFPFRWYRYRPTIEYIFGMILLGNIISIVSLEVASHFIAVPAALFEFTLNLTRCIVLCAILAVCIHYCFTVKTHIVYKIIYYILGLVFVALFIAAMIYPFTV